MAQQPQGAMAKSPGTGKKKPKYTIKELKQKQEKYNNLGPRQQERLEKAQKRAKRLGNVFNPPQPQQPAPKQLKNTLQQLSGKLAAGEELGPKQMARLIKTGTIAPVANIPASELTNAQQMSRLGAEGTTGISQQLGYLQNQGAFQPGSFQEQMDQAYQNIYGQFQRTQEPEFARQQADFRQMAAERGLDPNSEAYKTMQSQLNQSQDLARQTAMSQASQASYQAQAQGFGQAAQQYQMPAQMLQAYQPFVAQQGNLNQQQFEAYQSELERQARERLANIQGGYSTFGQLTPEQQFKMIKEKAALDFANQAALIELQPRPSTGAAIAGGLAQGIGSGIGSWIGGQ